MRISLPHRLLVSLGLLLVAARPVDAQPGIARPVTRSPEAPSAPAAVPANLRLIAIGNFLGQFDGFCEPPGGPYDLALESVEYCHPGGPGGTPPAGEKKPIDSPWPAALGGLIGAENWLADNRDAARPTPRLLIHGNNQTPDFADFLANRAKSSADASGVRPMRSMPASAVGTKASRRYAQAESASRLFWDRLATLKPAAVALGPDDFYRSLRPSAATRALDAAERVSETDTTASRFVEWVRTEQRRLPLLASNAILSVTGKRLNRLHVPGDTSYRLDLAEDASIGWLKQFTVAHPCGSHPTFVLESSKTLGAAAWRREPIQLATKAKPSVDCKATLELKKGALEPGRFFKLSYEVAGAAPKEVGTFRTHAALTPATSTAEALEGWPARLLPLTEGRTNDAKQQVVDVPDEMLIVSLVSRTTADVLGTPVWTWKAGASPNPHGDVCSAGPAVTCRLDFTPPADALAGILEQVLATRKRLPFIVLLSMMDDDDTLDIMERFPEIRVVVLPPDSVLLGRGSRATPEESDSLEGRLLENGLPAGRPDFSGDLGQIGRLDEDKPSLTRVVVRPEWVAETVADVELAVRYETDGDRGSRWAVRAPDAARARVETVPGVPLVERVGLPQDGFPTMEYVPLGHEELRTEPYLTQLACVEGDGRPMCAAFKKVWTDAGTLLSVAADALRGRSNADIIVMPQDVADADALAWMEHALSKGDTRWLTAYMLQRVTFRPYRFVRAVVGGDKLAATLQKILKDPLESGTAYCFAGLGDDLGCPSKLPDTRIRTLRVDGRVIQPSYFYTVTLPDRLAEKLELRHADDREDGFDVMDALRDHLSPAGSDRKPGDVGPWYPDGWGKSETPPSLVTRLEAKATDRRKHYVNLAELELGLVDTSVGTPDDSERIPNTIDFEGRGVRSYSSRSVVAKADAVLIDRKRQALRGVVEVEYARRHDVGAAFPAYERDRLLFGSRVDLWKIRTFGDLRPYLGIFQEGPMRRRRDTLQASRALDAVTAPNGTTATRSETSDIKIEHVAKENVFTYGAIGADAVATVFPIRSWLDAGLSKVKVEWARGTASSVPLDLVVDPDGAGALGAVNLAAIRAECPQTSATARTGDPATLLNAFYACRPNAVTTDTAVDLITQARRQSRTQIELEGTVGLKVKKRTIKFTLTQQVRYFRLTRDAGDSASLDLPVDRTCRFKLQVAIPVVWRLEAAPTFERQRARIRSGDEFTVNRWDVKVKLPLFFGFGGLFGG
jgi:hypothetical protein